MDLKDSLELIQETAVGASVRTEKPITLATLRDRTIYFHDGKQFEIAAQPGIRHHVAGCLQTIYDRHADNSAIWHNSNSVVLVLDDSDESDRADLIKLELTTSEKWCAATSDAKSARDQKAFIRFLKQNLRDEVNAALPGFLLSLEKVKFNRDASSEGAVQQGRESMGKIIKSEVTGTADFPETLVLQIRRWGELDFIGQIEFSLIIDTDNATFALVPLADTVKMAENAAHEWLNELIGEHVKCPVYFGKP